MCPFTMHVSHSRARHGRSRVLHGPFTANGSLACATLPHYSHTVRIPTCSASRTLAAPRYVARRSNPRKPKGSAKRQRSAGQELPSPPPPVQQQQQQQQDRSAARAFKGALLSTAGAEAGRGSRRVAPAAATALPEVSQRLSTEGGGCGGSAAAAGAAAGYSNDATDSGAQGSSGASQDSASALDRQLAASLMLLDFNTGTKGPAC
jgi:hypothetical protein